MIRNLLALTGFLAIVLISAIGIQAYGGFDSDDAPARVRVSYAGLDLASPEGVRILEQRINAAIDDVCGDDARELWRRRGQSECRRDAIAGVVPQVDYAIDRARRNRARVVAEEDLAPPPPAPYDDRDYAPPPPPSEPIAAPPPRAYAPPANEPPLRLVKRTVVTTRTVTSTGAGAPVPPPATRPAPAWRPAPKPLPMRRGVYRRLPEQPGSWLPRVAWRAIDGAIVRAFRTGRTTTPWSVADRAGYVTVSDKRWVRGCLCRNVRSVKYADGRQIVVAEGMKCLPRAR